MDVLIFKDKVWDLLRSINENINRTFLPYSEEQGLTMLQLRILLVIRDKTATNIGSLGRTLGLASANASSMCKRLEQDGFLARVRDTQDERIVNLTLTSKGIQVVQSVENALRFRFSPVMKCQSEEFMSTIVMGLENLNLLIQQLYEASQEAMK